MERIGVRELRQNASRYLARVSLGESLEVTDRGRPVAMLIPYTGNRWMDLLASGRILAPTEAGEIGDAEPADYGLDASAELEAMREDER